MKEETKREFKKTLIIIIFSISAVLLGLLIWGMVALCNQIEFWTYKSNQSAVTEKYKDYKCTDPNLVWIDSDGPYWNTYSHEAEGGYEHSYTYKK